MLTVLFAEQLHELGPDPCVHQVERIDLLLVNVSAVGKLLAERFELLLNHQGFEVAVNNQYWSLPSKLFEEFLLRFLGQAFRLIFFPQMVKPSDMSEGSRLFLLLVFILQLLSLLR